MGHVVKSSSAIYKDSVSRYTHEKTAVVFWNCNERGGLLFAVIAKRISRVWKKNNRKEKAMMVHLIETNRLWDSYLLNVLSAHYVAGVK